jgi:photosystem II stability/assembly factor-like uncharacterized protein
MKKLFITLVALFMGLHHASAQWKTTTQPVEHYPTNTIESIDGVLYAATNEGLYSSNDNGQNWQTVIANGGFKHILKTSGDTIVATGPGVQISYNKGTTWQYDTVGIYLKGEFRTIHYHQPSNQLFLSLGHPSYRLFYKTPSDASWTELTGSIVGSDSWHNVYHLVANGNKLFAVSYKYFFESTDNGQTWTKITTTGFPNTTDPAHSKSPFMAVNNNLYLTGEGGLYRSSDEGRTWGKISSGIINLFYNSPLATTMFADGNDLYIGCRGHNDSNFVYKSTNNGDSWEIYQDKLSSWPVSFTKHNSALFLTRFGEGKIYHDGNFGSSSVSKIINQNSFFVYPNPANNIINIQLYSTQKHNIKLFSITGELVLEKNTSEHTVIDVTTLTNGIYFLNITANGLTQTKKVVVAHD